MAKLYRRSTFHKVLHSLGSRRNYNNESYANNKYSACLLHLCYTCNLWAYVYLTTDPHMGNWTYWVSFSSFTKIKQFRFKVRRTFEPPVEKSNLVTLMRFTQCFPNLFAEKLTNNYSRLLLYYITLGVINYWRKVIVCNICLTFVIFDDFLSQ